MTIRAAFALCEQGGQGRKCPVHGHSAPPEDPCHLRLLRGNMECNKTAHTSIWDTLSELATTPTGDPSVPHRRYLKDKRSGFFRIKGRGFRVDHTEFDTHMEHSIVATRWLAMLRADGMACPSYDSRGPLHLLGITVGDWKESGAAKFKIPVKNSGRWPDHTKEALGSA